MYTSVELLDMVKARYSLPSYYATAPKIGVTKQQISRIRHGASFFGVDSCMVIADLLELDPLKIIASVQLERGLPHYNPKATELYKHYAA